MRNSTLWNGTEQRAGVGRLLESGMQVPRQLVIGLILILALFAFEMFNFDTTRYALRNLLGEVEFIGLGWATILAIAFCAIDFAGLARLFTPEQGRDEPKEIWYLTGAWLLGATMNALMTWWAISLTLLNHNLGNEVLSREQLLKIVPIFVAALVWLTRILFIGAVTIAGEHLLRRHVWQKEEPRRTINATPAKTKKSKSGGNRPAAADKVSPPAQSSTATRRRPATPGGPNSGRVRQRPPRPNSSKTSRQSGPAKRRGRSGA